MKQKRSVWQYALLMVTMILTGVFLAAACVELSICRKDDTGIIVSVVMAVFLWGGFVMFLCSTISIQKKEDKQVPPSVSPRKQVTVENFPDWAVPYIVNSDSSCYTKDEIDEMDEWRTSVMGSMTGIIDILSTAPYFSKAPAFGLACNCVDLIITFD